MLKGIDISSHQGDINWEKVKGQIDFAIIRCGYGMDLQMQDDSNFIRNVEECIRLGIPFGVYLFSYADTIEKAESEANHVLRLVEPYKNNLSYGIWYDLEDKIQEKLTKEELSRIISIFCEKITNNGYNVGIYANNYWLRTKIETEIKQKYEIWSAGYGTNDGSAQEDAKYQHKNVVMWQFTSKGKIDGINGNVDLDYLYKEINVENVENVEKPVENLTNNENVVETAGTYIVKSGDNLTTIAKKYHMSWQTLYENNRNTIGGNPNLIKPRSSFTNKCKYR